jgi:hypothetical protein
MYVVHNVLLFQILQIFSALFVIYIVLCVTSYAQRWGLALWIEPTNLGFSLENRALSLKRYFE